MICAACDSEGIRAVKDAYEGSMWPPRTLAAKAEVRSRRVNENSSTADQQFLRMTRNKVVTDSEDVSRQTIGGR